MPKTAEQKHFTKETWPRIKRSHKYQLLRQQAHYCVFKKNPYISHLKCESFLLHITMMISTAKQCTHKIMSTTGTVRYTNSLKNKVNEANCHLWRDSKADV